MLLYLHHLDVKIFRFFTQLHIYYLDIDFCFFPFYSSICKTHRYARSCPPFMLMCPINTLCGKSAGKSGGYQKAILVVSRNFMHWKSSWFCTASFFNNIPFGFFSLLKFQRFASSTENMKVLLSSSLCVLQPCFTQKEYILKPKFTFFSLLCYSTF